MIPLAAGITRSSSEVPLNEVHDNNRRKEAGHSLSSLDFLRGLMALVVLLSHSVLATGSTQEFPIIFFSAVSAVDVFMFISGFLMMWHFKERQHLEPWEKPKTWIVFYIRRFFRIAPLYYCALFLALGFQNKLDYLGEQNSSAITYPIASGSHDPTERELTVANVLSHVSFTFGFVPKFASNNHLPDWSIGLEMQFYMAFPFIVLLLRRTQFWGGVMMLMALNWLALKLFGVGITAELKPFGVFPMATFLPFRINCFLAGILIALSMCEKQNNSKRLTLMLLGLAVAAMYMKRFFALCLIFSIYELALSTGTGIPSLDRGVQACQGFVQSRLFKWMADVSYGVYLLHTLILTPVIWILLKTGHFADLHPALRFLICISLTIPIVYFVARLFHRWVEIPGIAIGKRIVKLSSCRSDSKRFLPRIP